MTTIIKLSFKCVRLICCSVLLFQLHASVAEQAMTTHCGSALLLECALLTSLDQKHPVAVSDETVMRFRVAGPPVSSVVYSIMYMRVHSIVYSIVYSIAHSRVYFILCSIVDNRVHSKVYIIVYSIVHSIVYKIVYIIMQSIVYSILYSKQYSIEQIIV